VPAARTPVGKDKTGDVCGAKGEGVLRAEGGGGGAGGSRSGGGGGEEAGEGAGVSYEERRLMLVKAEAHWERYTHAYI